MRGPEICAALPSGTSPCGAWRAVGSARMPIALRDLWRRGQEGWPRRYVLVQFPNLPLLVGLIAGLLPGAAARAIATAGLTAWAALEVVGGVNLFRRALGAAFLVYLAVTRLL